MKCLTFKCQNLEAIYPPDIVHLTDLPGYCSLSSLPKELHYLTKIES